MALNAAKISALLFLILISASLQPLSAQEGMVKQAKFSIGDILDFHSKILSENRTLNIYLPLGYSQESEKTYPVIYLLDGSADEDFVHIAGLVQFGSFSWIEMIPETIVVGIANVDRKRDFTYPSKNARDREEAPTSGGSATFIEMLEKEIQPLVEKTYRTSEVRTIIGQSLGGLLATEVLFKKPDLFDNYIIVSPSLWWDDQSLLSSKPMPISKAKSIFVAVGKEGEIMETVAEKLHAKIKKSRPKEARLWFQSFPELGHGDTLHLSVYRAFQKIFDEAH